MNTIPRGPVSKTLYSIVLVGLLIAFCFGVGGLPSARAQEPGTPFQAAPPVNDDFDNALEFGVPFTDTQDISEATKAADDPGLWCSPGPGGNTIWYKYVPTVSGVLTIDTKGSTVDTILAVWTGARGSLTGVGCNDDGAGLQSLLVLSVSAGTTYYIEAAAFDLVSSGSITFSASQMALNDFGKTGPGNGALINQPASPVLSWGESIGAASYEYCYDTSNNSACDGNWTDVGANTSIGLSGLSANTTYYWQARARSGVYTLEANGGNWWSFTVLPPAAGPFGKSSPSDGAANVTTSPVLSWSSSDGVTNYEYCYDTTNDDACDGAWTDAGVNTSASLSGLDTATTYYWQVRASNDGGTTAADGGTWWSFTTLPPLPASFGKSAPANGATGASASLTLSWDSSAGATGYEYCYDTTNDDACDGAWTDAGINTSASLSGLDAGATYYWQVRASNPAGITAADGGTWWSFTTLLPPPASFGKSAPANGATGASASPTLSWDSSAGATGYEYCYDTTNDDACDGAWTDAGINTSASLSGLNAGATYYWQVRASNDGGTTLANDGAWWSFTIKSSTEERPRYHWFWWWWQRLRWHRYWFWWWGFHR